jgi:hypothetical protein
MPQDWNYGTDRRGDASYCRWIRERRDFERNRLVSSTIVPYDVSSMDEQVQKALQVLIGKPTVVTGRAADLEWFQFGQHKTVKNVR